MKLSVLLGLREKVESTFKNMSDDMFDKFKSKGSLFKGIRKTYVARQGYADDDTKRGFTAVASTVPEQLDWFKLHTKDFLKTVFSIERTNAMGNVKAELIVDGQSFGHFSSLELLRAKSVLDDKFRRIISQIPVRNESIIWTISDASVYTGRAIWESPKVEGSAKTTLKESYIMHDPHADKPGRAPMTAERSTQVDIGDYTQQEFSGEASIRERAEMLVKLDNLYKGIIAALEVANEAEVVESNLGDKILDYLIS